MKKIASLKCSDLTENSEVVFNIYSDIHKEKRPETGNVLGVNKNNRTVCVCWLEGYKSRMNFIPYEDMLAVADENGEMMRFDNISGKSIKLTAN